MSILIPGMKMPADKTVLLVYPNGTAISVCASGHSFIVFHEELYADYEGSNKSKAVELPPHGRLGDLDALAAKDDADYEHAMECIADVSSRSVVCQIHYAAQRMIAEADTIIPAERGYEAGGRC